VFVNAGFGGGRVEGETVLKNKTLINISHSVDAGATRHLTIAETRNRTHSRGMISNPGFLQHNVVNKRTYSDTRSPVTI
jgi:hypothetical protein